MSFFNKSNGGTGSAPSKNTLQPPKNLPDLARDIYEKDASTQSSNSISDSNNNAIINSEKTFKESPIKIQEPDRKSVPELDLSFVRQNLGSNQNKIPTSLRNELKDDYTNLSNTNLSNNYSKNSNNSSFPPTNPSPSYSVPHAGLINESMILDDGFFKEFEEHLINNSLDDDILGDLMNKSLLDKMVFYHTAKSESSPFYANNAELSHALKLKLEELKSLERAWITNNSKLQLLKKFNSSIEYDISIRSEELKKILSESKKRGTSMSSNDSSNFFQITKPKDTSANVYTNNLASSNLNNNNNNNGGKSSVINGLLPQGINFISQNTAKINSSSTSNSGISGNISNTDKSALTNTVNNSNVNSVTKYLLSKYITNDPTKFFYCKNGKVYRSLLDLINDLKVMDEITFKYHVNDSKNDFSKWVSGVFIDYKLSESMKSLHDRLHLIEYLITRTY